MSFDRSSRDAAWTRIMDLAARPDARLIRPLFAADPDRAARYTHALDDITLDHSKSSVDDAARDALLALCRDAGLDGFRRRLFAGEVVNPTEGRAAMHMALRAPASDHMKAALPGGTDDAASLVADELARMHAFVTEVHEGRIVGATGAPFEAVLNIGIGGSDLGPRMATEVLTRVHGGRMEGHFLSNVDGHAWAAVSRLLDPATTLVLVASKTFTTLETLTNARAARDWIAGALGEDAVGTHFAALSTNQRAVEGFGIPAERMFGFRDWVGGRYSLWSAVGLSIALAAGWDSFQRLLDGGHAMDVHFRDAPFADNLPVWLALTGIWHVDALGLRTHCVLAYDERLRRFPAYLQQLEMESNGKSVALDGDPVTRPTCPVVFGEPGTDAQHSFMQLVHQGTQAVPVDFLLAAIPDHDRPTAHRILAANAFAQAEALLRGKSLAEVTDEMTAAHARDVGAVAPHRVFAGDRPSNTILFERLDAFTLGRLIALYEHKVAVQGWLWGIDSFDQWGVELGKVLAGGILPLLEPGVHADLAGTHDGSTASLVARFHALRGD